jgi:hypothetical protein
MLGRVLIDGLCLICWTERLTQPVCVIPGYLAPTWFLHIVFWMVIVQQAYLENSIRKIDGFKLFMEQFDKKQNS